jgi:hypothetical protein
MKVPLLLLVASLALFTAGSVRAEPRSALDASCDATPITHKIPNRSLVNLSHNWVHIGKLWMGYTLADSAFESDPTGQKIAWWREKGSAFGKLRVTGKRLDAEAPPLTAHIPSGYANTWGFQSSGLYFPTPGCWQVVARVGLTQRYVFVVNVVQAS